MSQPLTGLSCAQGEFSRRPLVTRRSVLAGAIAAAVVGPGRAQPPAQAASPTRRRATGRGASRFVTRTRTSSRSIHASRSTSCSTRRSCGSHGHTLVRGPRVERGRPLCRLERHPEQRQLRFIEDDARVTTFRQPSGNSNGNTFDFEGRQLSCEHGGRRVARYEPMAASRRSPSATRQATELAERHRGAPRRQHLVH